MPLTVIDASSSGFSLPALQVRVWKEHALNGPMDRMGAHARAIRECGNLPFPHSRYRLNPYLPVPESATDRGDAAPSSLTLKVAL